MKIWALGYGIGFLFFAILVVIIAIQNLGGNVAYSFLRMKVSIFNLLFAVASFGILQGVLLVLLVKSFFTGMQRPELTKFDLDKPL